MKFFGNKLFVLMENFKKSFHFKKLVNMINKMSLKKLKYIFQSEQKIKIFYKKYFSIGISFNKFEISFKRFLYNKALKIVMKKINVKEKITSIRTNLKYNKFVYINKTSLIFRLKNIT